MIAAAGHVIREKWRHGLAILLFVLVTLGAAAQTTVYVTRTGEKYHRGACQYLRQSKIEMNADSAMAMGYTPCSVCKPSSGATRSNVVTAPSQERTTSVQCSAKTKSGTRCSRQTKSGSGRCWQHE